MTEILLSDPFLPFKRLSFDCVVVAGAGSTRVGEVSAPLILGRRPLHLVPREAIHVQGCFSPKRRSLGHLIESRNLHQIRAENPI